MYLLVEDIFMVYYVFVVENVENILEYYMFLI